MFSNDTLSITIINNTTAAKPWVAFGFNKGLQNVPGVIVSVSESSLQQATTESASIPFKVQSIKIKTQTDAQLGNPITIQTSDATGQLEQSIFTPLDYYDVDTKVPNLVKINNPNIIISGQVALNGVIAAGQTMNIILKLQKQSGFSNFIKSIFSKSPTKNWSIKWRLLPE